jgi:hypothetical protein
MSETTWHRGDWMQTYSGRQFYPLAADPEDISGDDIAHSLSLICRYGGHIDRFYSVAEHCVLMSYYVAEEYALWALLHDATEAYVGDMVRPLKRQIPQYVEIEDRLMRVIVDAYNLATYEMPAAVKDADNRILLDERAVLFVKPPAGRWAVDGLEPLGVHISGWAPEMAEVAYAARLAELTAALPRPLPVPDTHTEEPK